jgi:SsrA-binding protein
MEKVIATNKKAYHDYFVEDSYEAGIVLLGSEVKSVRLGQVNLRDSYAVIKNGEAFLVGTHISPYEKGSFYNSDARRTRKLLLNKFEINKLRGKVEQKGYTLVPLKLYFKDALVKVEIGLCKGKELHDKRETIKRKEEDRMLERVKKEYRNKKI